MLALSGLAIAGIALIVIGIIMAIIGIIILIVHDSTTSIPWYVWVLIVGGILMGIIGGIMLAVALSETEKPVSSCYTPIAQPVCPLAAQPISKCGCPHIQPVYQPPVYSERTEVTGQETFDPDPQTSVLETPAKSRRRTVIGPYGPNGSDMKVSGVHTLPATRKIITRDIPNHPVSSDIY